MADLDDQSVDGAGASDQPAATAETPDLEAIVTRVAATITGQLDKRFQGFQSQIDKKLGTMTREFQAAGLSPEQREQLDESDREAETAALRRKVELYELAGQYPRGVELMSALMGDDVPDLEAQLALIEQKFGAGAAAQVAEAAAGQEPASGAQTPVPEVDRNNPSRELQHGAQSAITADEMTDEAADAILAGLGKGALTELRRQQGG